MNSLLLKLGEFSLASTIGLLLTFKFGTSVYESLIISSLLFIIFLLIESSWNQNKTHALAEIIDGQIIEIGYQRFDNHLKLYSSLGEALDRATEEVLLTHLRQETPSDFKHGKPYFDKVELWCSKHPNGLVKRVSCAPTPDMEAFCLEQTTIADKTPNFFFKHIEWSASFPNINFAILDKKIVYVFISGSVPSDASGFYLEDPKTVGYFRQYFEHLFSSKQ